MSHNQNRKPYHHLILVEPPMNQALPKVLFNHQFQLHQKQKRKAETVNINIQN